MTVPRKSKTAVVLFNLGGPDCIEAVQPFLFQLFCDPAIIPLSFPLRYLVAKLLSWYRCREASQIYQQLGGCSPLLENTQHQALALEKALGDNYRVFVCMRYWRPRAEEVVEAIQMWGAQHVILIPLYPQFSTTTTGSSLKEWYQIANRKAVHIPTQQVCCYPVHEQFLNAHKELIVKAVSALPVTSYRLLLTAHGLPQRVVDRGDPYAWQVQSGVQRLVHLLDIPGLDWRLCYQSRVGPLKWLRPYTDDEIILAAQQGKGVVIVPFSFVSEHAETKIELDRQYQKLAEVHGAPFYLRVPALGCHPRFIKCLKDLVVNEGGANFRCPSEYRDCFMCNEKFLSYEEGF
jgi:ferrochelatase